MQFIVPDCEIALQQGPVRLPVADRRDIKNSGGNVEHRVVVHTDIVVGHARWAIELTLTDRKQMLFPMLLGRKGIPLGWLVDPSRSRIQGKPHV